MDPSSSEDPARPRDDEIQNLTVTDQAVQLALSNIAMGHAPEPELTENLIEAEKKYWEEHGPPPSGYTLKDMHAKFLSDTLLCIDETDKQLKAAAAEVAELDAVISDSGVDEDGPPSQGSNDNSVHSDPGEANIDGGSSASRNLKPEPGRGGTMDREDQVSEKDYELAAPTNIVEARRHVLDQLFNITARPKCRRRPSDAQTVSPVPTEPWSRPASPGPELRSFPGSPTRNAFNRDRVKDSETMLEAHYQMGPDYHRFQEIYHTERKQWRAKENTMQRAIEEHEKSLEKAENTQKALRALNQEMMHRLQGKDTNPDPVLSSALEAAAQSLLRHKAGNQSQQKRIQALQATLKSEEEEKNIALLRCTTLTKRIEFLEDHMKSAKTGAYALLRNAEIHLDKASVCRHELESAVQRVAKENGSLLRRATEAERKLETATQDTVPNGVAKDEIEKLRGQMVAAQEMVADLEAQNERLVRTNLESSEDMKRLERAVTNAEENLAEARVTLGSDVKRAEDRAAASDQEKGIAGARILALEVTLQRTEHHKEALRVKVTQANARAMDAQNLHRQQAKELRKAEAALKSAHAKLHTEIREKQILAAYLADQKTSAECARAKVNELSQQLRGTRATVAKLQNTTTTLQRSLDQALAGQHWAQSQLQQVNSALQAEQNKAANLTHLLAVAQQAQHSQLTESMKPTGPTPANTDPLALEQAQVEKLSKLLETSQHALHESRASVGSLKAQLSAATMNQVPSPQGALAHQGGVDYQGGLDHQGGLAYQGGLLQPSPPEPAAMMALVQQLESQKQLLCDKVETLTEEKESWERQFLQRNAYVIVMENQAKDWKEWLSKAPQVPLLQPGLEHHEVEIPNESTHRVHFGQIPVAHSSCAEEMGIDSFNNVFADHVFECGDKVQRIRNASQVTVCRGMQWDEKANSGDITVELCGNWMDFI